MSNLAEQVSVSIPTVPLVFDGKTVDCQQLCPAELAEVVRYVKGIRRATFLERGIPINPATNAVLAAALAQIQCTPIQDRDLLLDYDAHIKGMQLALCKSGTKVTETDVGKKLDHTQEGYFDKVAQILGLLRVGEKPPVQPDPTRTNEMTS